MCGIAGFIGFKDETLIKRFSKLLEHRGPDGEGYFIDNDVTLLSRRLSIIDVKGGGQPIYNEDRSMVIVYNGEIYNYQELRKELEIKGHVFKTVSDTEVILHGYEQWREACFDKLNGMFAIAIHDIKKKKTVLVRDHFGIKPLYFSLLGSTDSVTHVFPASARSALNTPNLRAVGIPNISATCRVVFTSEIKPLIYSGLIPVEPNDRIIYRYLKYRIHDDGRETFFKGIERLLPGEMMIIEKGQNSNLKSQIKKFTKLEEKLMNRAETQNGASLQKQQISQFKTLLIDSIKRRLVSEVPLGTCLSGGLDSSTVVSVVNKLLQEKVGETQSVGDIQKTFSAVFPRSSNDEERYINELLETSKDIKDYKVYPKVDEFFKDLKDFVKTQEEPTISTGPYAQYKVMQEAHKHVTVVLDGQGADEMMAGYVPYYFVYLKQLWKARQYVTFIKEAYSSKDVILKLLFRSKSKEVRIKNVLNKGFAGTYKDEMFIIENNNIKKRLHEDIFKNSLQSLLRYEDKNAMWFSIEGRVPFLDFRLLEFLFTLPEDAIIKNGWNKYILRESTKDLLPELINKRRNKIGFTTPEYEWFKKESDTILEFFTGEQFEAKKYVNQVEIVMAFKDFVAGKTDDTMFFWRILNLELWMREFIVKKLNPKSEIPALQAGRLNSNQTSDSKQIKNEIIVEGKKYLRYPIRTEVFKKGDDVLRKITEEVNKFIQCHSELVSESNYRSRNKFGMTSKQIRHDTFANKKWFIVVSEKIVATAQGRAYFIWDIKPSLIATVLSKCVSRVPWGIGLGGPWTMQLAIQEVGLPRILFASIIGGIGKIIGKKGLFYQIAGRSAAGIDGPTEYSLYPANVSAKLLPKEPQRVCEQIDITIKNPKSEITNPKLQISNNYKVSNLPFEKPQGKQSPISNRSQYLGSAIIDANDIGRNVLGNTISLSNKLIEEIFKDNPMGQTNEQTPITIVIKL